MANDKELNIHLKTTADPSGLAAVEQALKDVGATSESVGAAAQEQAEKERQYRQENAELIEKWTKEWGEQARAAGQETVEALKEVEEEAARAAEAAETAADAGVRSVGLQKATQLKEIASQAREIGAALKGAMDSIEDGEQGVVEQFSAIADAGTSATAGIAAGFLAFGPAGAVTVAVLAGLNLVAQVMAEQREASKKHLDEQMDQLALVKKTVLELNKAMGRDQDFDFAKQREDLGQRRALELEEAERERSRQARLAEEGRTVGDLEDVGPDGPDKARRRATREEQARRQKDAAEEDALRKRQQAETDYRANLSGQSGSLDKDSRQKEIDLLESGLTNNTDDKSRKEVQRLLAEIKAMRAEREAILKEIKESEERSRRMRAEDEDGDFDDESAGRVNRVRGKRSVDDAWDKELDRGASERERARKKAQDDFNKLNKERGGITSDRADDFMKSNKRGNDFSRMDRAFDDLKDGATEQELAKAKAVLLEFRGTVLARDAKNAAALSELFKMVGQLGEDLKKADQRAKNERG